VALQYVGKTDEVGAAAAVTTFTTDEPAGTAVGDLMLWKTTYNNNSIQPPPSGWLAWTGASTTALGQATWYRFKQSGDPSSWSYTGISLRWGHGMESWRGVDTTTPQDVTPVSAVGTTLNGFPAITPVTAGAHIVADGAMLGPTSTTNVTWATNNLDALSNDFGSNVTTTTNAFLGSGYEAWTSGAFTPNLTHAVTSTRTISIAYALRPASGAAYSDSVALSGDGTLSATGTVGGVTDFSGSASLNGSGTLAAAGIGYNEFTYEEGTPGNVMTTSSPGVNGVIGGAPSAAPYYVASPFTGHGSVAARCDTITVVNNSWFRYDNYFGDLHTGQIYVQFDTIVSSNNPIVGFREPGIGASNTALIGQIRQGTGASAGKIILFSGASVVAATSTVVFSSGDKCRLDWNFYKHGDLYDMTVRIFKNSNVEGTVPDDTISATNMGIASAGLQFGTITLGIFSANPGVYTYDTFRAWQGVNFWPAPYGVTAPAFSGTATLAGDGSLSTAQVPQPVVTAALSGDGTLGAVGIALAPGAANLSGIGTLSTTQKPTAVGTAVLSGSGTLSTTQAPRPVVSAALSGAGTLAAVGAVAAATLTHLVSGMGWTDGATYATAVVTGTTNATSVRLKVADDAGITTNIRYTSPVTPDADGYATHQIDTIAPGGTAYYQVEMTGGSVTLGVPVGKAKAAPTKGVAAGFSMNFGSCQQSAYPGNTAIWSAMATHLSPDLWMHLGDSGYDNNASTLQADHRTDLMDEMNGRPAMAAASYQTPSVWQRSDHDSGPGDNDPGAYNTADLAARKQIYPYPPLPNPSDGLYFDSWIGKIHLIMIDSRTIGRSLRGATDNSSKTKLGATQKAWLLSKIAEPCDFLVFISECAWVGDGWSAGTAVSGVTTWNLGIDGWVRFTNEADQIAAAITAAGLTKKMIMLSGDSHLLAADTGFNNLHGGFPVAVAAPLDRASGGGNDGGPYTNGTYWRSTQGTVTQQFGNLTVDANGTAVYTGWDVQDLVTPKVTMKISQDGAVLSGSGTLVATGVAVSTSFTGTATLGGSGSLTTTQKPSVPAAASLSGTGTLSTTQKPAPAFTAALSGAGTLTTAQIVTAATTAVFTGTGTLIALQVYSLTTVEWASNVVSSTGWVNPSNAVGADNSTYATWTSSTANAVSSPLEVGFGTFTAVPPDATNISVRVRVKGYWS